MLLRPFSRLSRIVKAPLKKELSLWKLLDTSESRQHNEPKISRALLRGEFALSAALDRTDKV
jgi:hypothetical protein